MTGMRGKAIVVGIAMLGAALLVPGEAQAHGWRHPYWRSHYRYPHHHHYGAAAFGFGLGLLVGHLDRPHVVYRTVPYRAYVVNDYATAWGEIETDVKPDSAAVYLDGRAVGIADDFNGWPSKLAVQAGSHDLTFREPGYRPLRVTVNVLPGHSVRIRERMVRALDDRAMEEYRVESDAPDDPAPRPQDRYERQERRETPPPSGGFDRGSGERGTLVLEVPEGALVYVDGRRWPELDGRRSLTLDLSAGTHQVEVVKPGHDTFQADVRIRAGQRQELRVRLVPESH